LLSRGSACWANAVAAKARTKQPMMVRFITFHVRRIPTCRRTQGEDSSAGSLVTTKISGEELRTSRRERVPELALLIRSLLHDVYGTISERDSGS